MKKLSIFILFLLSSCVSIGPKAVKRNPSDFVTFNSPNSPFTEHDWDSVDKMWKDNKTGSTISYYSNCSSDSDPSLSELEKDVLYGVNELKKNSSQKIPYNSREALKSHYSGSVDGVATDFSLLVFKKNNCIYILTYIALKKHYKVNVDNFNSFIENFKVDKGKS